MYFPRIAGPGPLRGPAGAVAGVIARSDVLRGVWASPAGVEATLRWVEELSLPVSDAENGRLNPLGVNCLRNFAGAGPVGVKAHLEPFLPLPVIVKTEGGYALDWKRPQSIEGRIASITIGL